MPLVSKKFLNKTIVVTFGIAGVILSFVYPFVANNIVGIVVVHICYSSLT